MGQHLEKVEDELETANLATGGRNIRIPAAQRNSFQLLRDGGS